MCTLVHILTASLIFTAEWLSVISKLNDHLTVVAGQTHGLAPSNEGWPARLGQHEVKMCVVNYNKCVLNFSCAKRTIFIVLTYSQNSAGALGQVWPIAF